MNSIHSAALSFALVLLPLGPARAGSNPGNPSAVIQAKAIFEDIETTSAEISDVAERLEERAQGPGDEQGAIEGLDALKAEVNRIGSDLSTLEAERASLAPWQVEALDRTTSLMLDIAANSDKAIETYNTQRNHLWATAFPVETAKAANEADEVKTLLSGYLKLEKARGQEERLERSLKAVPQN
jgi:hypothetical protein